MSRLLRQVNEVMKVKQYSVRTEIAYQHWIKRFLTFYQEKHPCELGAREIRLFLLHLVIVEQSSFATRQVAQAALLFLYREVLQKDLPELDDCEPLF